MVGIDKTSWQVISPLLDELLDTDTEERAARLVQLRASDPALAAELASLLSRHAAIVSERFLEETALCRIGGHYSASHATRLGIRIQCREAQEGSSMAVYVVAQLSFVDRSAYDRYQRRFMEVMSRYRGSLLAADEQPSVLEGVWDRDKLVLLSFPDAAAFREWSESAEYREILKDRKAGATAVVLLVRGVPGASSAAP